MNIFKFPDPVLLMKCEEVTDFTNLSETLEEMYVTMKEANGVGLAANQVGLLQRMFVMLGESGEKIFLVNPKIVRRSVGFANLAEGCLSAPGAVLVRPDRAAWVEVEYQNENGEKYKQAFKYLQSVIVQHEMAHLQGQVFFLDPSLPKKKRIELAKKWGLKIK